MLIVGKREKEIKIKMKKYKYLTFFLLGAIFALVFAVSVCAETDPKVYIIDESKWISDKDAETVMETAERFAEKSGFNIIICVCDDIGEPKTDEHTVTYADDMYDGLCGINTDGILFLINNDTEYDYISTSGDCINYYSDYRIERLFDSAYDNIISRNFAEAAMDFLDTAEYYYDMGKANHQTDVMGAEVEAVDFFAGMLVMGIIALIVGIIIFFNNLKKYRLEKPSGAFYINKNTLSYKRFEDVFLGNFTNRIYSPRSSGSSGGGGGGRSSTHRSRSGGRHGGGGRHR